MGRQVEVEPDIHRAGGMGERADGDEIHAGLGDGADAGQGHAAAGLGLRAAFALLHGQAQLNQVHVVEQDDVGPRRDRLLDLLQRVGFDLHLEARDSSRARAGRRRQWRWAPRSSAAPGGCP